MKLLASLAGFVWFALPLSAQDALPLRTLGVFAYVGEVDFGDLDGDGKQDVLAQGSHGLTSGFAAAFGDGVRGFDGRVEFSNALGRAVAIGDVDGDGSNEAIIATDPWGAGYAFQTWKLDRTQEMLVAETPTVFEAASLVAADFDADGRVDLAGLPNSQSPKFIGLFRGLGDGAFAAAGSVQIGASISGIDAADVDSDGLLDLVGGAGSSVFIALQTPGLTFAPCVFIPKTSGLGVTTFEDFDSDGHVDLLAVGYPSGWPPPPFSTGFFRGLGAGAFAPPVLTPLTGGPVIPRIPRIADFDGDGTLDIASFSATQLELWFGAGGISFTPGPIHRTATLPSGWGAADHDGNVAADAFVRYGGDMVLHVNPGVASIDVPRRVPSTKFTPDLVADATGDGRPDVLGIADAPKLGIIVHPGLGDGGFTSELALSTSTKAYHVAVGDLDRDGDPDVAALTASFPGTVAVFSGDGSGNFAAAVETVIPGAFVGPSSDILCVDLDNDGYLEVLIGGYHLVICKHVGGGALTVWNSVKIVGGVSGVLTADFDRDGWTDVAAFPVSAPYDDANVLRNLGQGILGAPTVLDLGGDTQAGAVLDVDGDGWSDLAFFSTYSTRVTWFLGRGDGTFSPPRARSFNSWHLPQAFARIRADGDTCDDLLLHRQGGGYTVEVLRGTKDGDFARAETYVARKAPLVVGDLDLDGREDLITDEDQSSFWVSLHR
ncbi:MAG: VCBS repeat-containing protein [Planctomycetes bacterium]|nr:VCBS repeat-containing protein [Planctomycetota bacterium]